MPLAYDDIPGSWGTYSEGWPSLSFNSNQETDRAFIVCTKTGLIPYGSYVCVGFSIRFESQKELRIIQEYLDSSPYKTYDDLVKHFIDIGIWERRK